MTTKEKMNVCSEYVRQSPCVFCLHYKECVARGEPVSNHGRFWAEFLDGRFPHLRAFKNKKCRGLGTLHIVHAYEFEDAVFALTYTARDKHFRRTVQLTTTDEELEAWLFYCYKRATAAI